MEHRLTMVYWKGEKFWLGKLMEHPEIMTQGWGHLNLRRTFSICMIASREGILSPSSHRETVAMATPILLATSTCVN